MVARKLIEKESVLSFDEVKALMNQLCRQGHRLGEDSVVDTWMSHRDSKRRCSGWTRQRSAGFRRPKRRRPITTLGNWLRKRSPMHVGRQGSPRQSLVRHLPAALRLHSKLRPPPRIASTDHAGGCGQGDSRCLLPRTSVLRTSVHGISSNDAGAGLYGDHHVLGASVRLATDRRRQKSTVVHPGSDPAGAGTHRDRSRARVVPTPSLASRRRSSMKHGRRPR